MDKLQAHKILAAFKTSLEMLEEERDWWEAKRDAKSRRKAEHLSLTISGLEGAIGELLCYLEEG